MIKKRIVLMVLVFAFFLFAACAVVEYQTPVLEGPEHVMEKNYEINKQQTVYAGRKMLEAKDFWAFFSTRKKMKALNDFTIEGHDVKHSGSTGDMYNIVLTTDVNKTMTYFIEIPNVFRRFGIGVNGGWQNVQFLEGEIQKARTPITPRDTTFELVEVTNIKRADASRPFTWFEIIFTGKAQDAFHLVYKEYAPDSLERPVIEKNLSYPVDAETIRYEQIRIKIHDVTNERISYTVIADGLEK